MDKPVIKRKPRRALSRRRFLAAGSAVATAQIIFPLSNIASRAQSPMPKKSALRGYEEQRRLEVTKYINAVSWNFDGSKLAALSNYGGNITLWNSKSWSISQEFQRYGGAYSQNSFTFLPDGTLLTAAPIGPSSDPKYQTLSVFAWIQWSCDDGRPVRYIPDLGTASSKNIGPAFIFSISHDGTLVAGTSKSGCLIVRTHDWSIVRWIPCPPTPHHPDGAACVALSSNSREVAMGTGFGYVHIFDVESGVRRLSFRAFSGRCGAIAYSPANGVLATGRGLVSISEADDGFTRIWRPADGMLLARLIGGDRESVRQFAWSPDGEVLAVAADHSLKIWNTSTLPQEPRLDGNEPLKQGYSVAFSPRGVLAVSDGATVIIYSDQRQ